MDRTQVAPGWSFSYQIILKTIIYYFHHLPSSPDIHQSVTRSGCQAMGTSPSFICFLGLAFLIALVPLDKFIVIAIINIIMPYFYLLLCHKRIRDMPQIPWSSAHCPNAHLLSLKAIGNKKKCCRPDTHCLLTHFLRNEVIRNIQQAVWFSAHCFVTHGLGPKMVRDKSQWAWLHAHCFIIHSLCLKTIKGLSYPAWNICISHIYLYPWT